MLVKMENPIGGGQKVTQSQRVIPSSIISSAGLDMTSTLNAINNSSVGWYGGSLNVDHKLNITLPSSKNILGVIACVGAADGNQVKWDFTLNITDSSFNVKKQVDKKTDLITTNHWNVSNPDTIGFNDAKEESQYLQLVFNSKTGNASYGIIVEYIFVYVE